MSCSASSLPYARCQHCGCMHRGNAGTIFGDRQVRVQNSFTSHWGCSDSPNDGQVLWVKGRDSAPLSANPVLCPPAAAGPSHGSASAPAFPHSCAGAPLPAARGPALPESSTARLSPRDGNSGVLQLQGEKITMKKKNSRGMKLMDAFVRLVLAFWSSAVLIGRDMVAIKANELTNIYIFSFESKPALIRNQKEKKLWHFQ